MGQKSDGAFVQAAALGKRKKNMIETPHDESMSNSGSPQPQA
jgi:hypothetical protein